MDIALCRLYAVMTQHLFDLENGSACLQQILSVSMSETVSGFGDANLVKTCGDVIADSVMGDGPVGGGQRHKEGSVFDARSYAGHINDNGHKGLLWQRQAHGDRIFSIGNADFFFGKGDIIERNEADLLRPETEGVCQVDHGIAADIPGLVPAETGEETLQFLWPEEPWGFGLGIERRPSQEG